MKLVAAYLITFLFVLVALLLFTLSGYSPSWISDYNVVIQCCFAGGFGAVSYCLWAIYYHYSREQDWDDVWIPWYLLRPILGIIIGGFTYFLVAAGLFVLEASPDADASYLGIFALAFIAGLNTDQFIAKTEDLVSNIWGIEPSGLSKTVLKKAPKR
ncbi:hypothetical protein [Lewinella sp. W8]|uniref:hypothetical protein n=1 Tax=Lewinella sp. W8 TaxID=2528208 RepID=UPI001067BE95|nr:hypothetical protein [Lewinella sp. W8]MTB53444.1 hypothetical protein [Lewinella sp. W8]